VRDMFSTGVVKVLRDELFGPIATVFVYPDRDFETLLRTVDETSEYGLTGAIFARDRVAIETASMVLRHAAGNFYGEGQADRRKETFDPPVQYRYPHMVAE